MRLFSFVALLVLVSAALSADAQIPPQGDAATFDVATWNIENFGTGSGGAAQRDIVVDVIRAADIDLWALQEIVDVNDFNALLQELENDGYRGVLGPDPGGGGQRLAYVYNENVVTSLATQTVLAGNEFSFAGRLPFLMLARVDLNGQSQQLRVLNIHAKCCSDTSSYNRRAAAAQVLKDYTDGEIDRGRTVLLLGDFNDRLNVSITSGQLSPYRAYRTDPDDYTIATFDIDRLNVPTFCSNTSCSSGSAIDHVLFSNDLASSYVENSGDRYIELVQAIPSYTNTASDHLPVLAQFTLIPTAGEPAPESSGVELLPPAPMPFREATTLRFRLDEPGLARVEVFDALGRRVTSVEQAYTVGEHAVHLDGATLAPGVYVARLSVRGVTATQTLLRAR
ncbi:MAG: endonuclease/exonuclease/phosphatase family protein [Bacteroidota bacterium]